MKSPQRPKENETPTCNRLGRDDHLGHLLLDIGHCAGASTPHFARHPPGNGKQLAPAKAHGVFLPGGVGLDMLSGRGSKGEHPPLQHPSGIRRIWPFGLLKISLRPQVNRWQHLYPLAQSAHSAHSQPYSIGLLCQDLPQDRSHPQRHHWRSVRSNLVEMVPTPEKLSRSKWGSASKKIV